MSPGGYSSAELRTEHSDLYAVSGAVFRACADAGVTLLEMRLKKADLEDVFLELAATQVDGSFKSVKDPEVRPSEDAEGRKGEEA